MSRILIHSNAPWMPSGYGKQCAHLVRTLQTLGHEVAVSAFAGLTGAPIEWEGAPVLPSGMYEYGIDVLIPHIEAVKPDLTIALMDVWKLGPIVDGLKDHNMAAWVPVDCHPLSRLDHQFLFQAGVRPIAMSRFGETQLRSAGLDPLYAPHVVDRQMFKPLEHQERLDYRERMGVDGRFIVGMCAANNDAVRKGFPEQFEAFRMFQAKNPEALLWVHSIARTPRGLDLQRLALEIGIPHEAIRFTDTYAQVSGAFDDTLLADWYGVLDVLSVCSFAEAFGVPLIEAQACGTPVITTRGSAMRELGEVGWTVPGDRYWNHVHGAWWERPKVDGIARTFARAKEAPASRRENAVAFTEAFEARGQDNRDRWESIVKSLLA